jgi:GR25 family glycosyltransferase involved in LPS biosynthesis
VSHWRDELPPATGRQGLPPSFAVSYSSRMKCVYINLDQAVERRRKIEANLAAAVPFLRPIRFSAVPAAEAQHVPGRITPQEKGCFLSHLRVLEGAVDDVHPLLVLEDDAVISPRFADVITQALAATHLDWDLLFTDVVVYSLDRMVELAKSRDGLIRSGSFRLIDLQDIPFFAASAYVVKPASKAKVLGALRQADNLDVPYDVLLRRLVGAGRLKARMCFPFVTTITENNGPSQIQPGEHAFGDLTINTFRRLMFVDRDLSDARKQAKMLQDCAKTDEGAELTGLVFWAFTTPHFPRWRARVDACLDTEEQLP